MTKVVGRLRPPASSLECESNEDHQLEVRPGAATLQVIRCTLEIAGVEFIDENGGGPGVAATKAAPEEELGRWAMRHSIS